MTAVPHTTLTRQKHLKGNVDRHRLHCSAQNRVSNTTENTQNTETAHETNGKPAVTHCSARRRHGRLPAATAHRPHGAARHSRYQRTQHSHARPMVPLHSKKHRCGARNCRWKGPQRRGRRASGGAWRLRADRGAESPQNRHQQMHQDTRTRVDCENCAWWPHGPGERGLTARDGAGAQLDSLGDRKHFNTLSNI